MLPFSLSLSEISYSQQRSWDYSLSSGCGTRQLTAFLLGEIGFLYIGGVLRGLEPFLWKSPLLDVTACSKHTRLLTVTSYLSGIPLFKEGQDRTFGASTAVKKGKQNSLKLRQILDAKTAFFLCSGHKTTAENKEGPSFCNSPSFRPFKQDGQKLRLVSAGSPSPWWHCTGSDFCVAQVSQAENKAAGRVPPQTLLLQAATMPFQLGPTTAAVQQQEPDFQRPVQGKDTKKIQKLLRMAFLTNAVIFQSFFWAIPEKRIRKQSRCNMHFISRTILYIYIYFFKCLFWLANHSLYLTIHLCTPSQTCLGLLLQCLHRLITHPPEWELFSDRCGKTGPLVHTCEYPAHTL